MLACFLYLSKYSYPLVDFKLVFCKFGTACSARCWSFCWCPSRGAQNFGREFWARHSRWDCYSHGNYHFAQIFFFFFFYLSFSCLFIQGEHSRDNIVGINLQTGGTLDPQMEGIFDNYSVKRQLLNSGYTKISSFWGGPFLSPYLSSLGAAPLPPLWLTYCINVHVKRYFCQTSPKWLNYKKPDEVLSGLNFLHF